MNPWIVLPMLAALAVFFVMLPVGSAVYAQFRRRKVLRCPVAEADATIRVDATQAGVKAALGVGPTIAECSLWPQRRGCGQDCLRLPVSAVHDAPAAPSRA